MSEDPRKSSTVKRPCPAPKPALQPRPRLACRVSAMVSTALQLCACVCLCARAASTSASEASTVVVGTSVGRIAGTRLPSGAQEFLGIPYATAERWESPVDWTAPLPSGAAPGAFSATAYGPMCPQQGPPPPPDSAAPAPAPGGTGGRAPRPPQPVLQPPPAGPMSEACLFINVHRPPAGVRGAAVLVFLHGGGMMMGSGAAANGTNLALSQVRQRSCVLRVKVKANPSAAWPVQSQSGPLATR